MMKTLLKHGRIYDGTGADAFFGDILIENDRILDEKVPMAKIMVLEASFLYLSTVFRSFTQGD